MLIYALAFIALSLGVAWWTKSELVKCIAIFLAFAVAFVVLVY